MGPNGSYAWVVFGSLAKVLFDAAHGPKLGATGPTRRSVYEHVYLRSLVMFPRRVGSESLDGVESHIALVAYMAIGMYEKWVPEVASLLLFIGATPIYRKIRVQTVKDKGLTNQATS